jgi:hypothetical protein
VSRPVNGKTVEIRLLIFPATTTKLYTDLLLVGGGFSPVLGAALTASTLPPPQPRNRGEAKENQGFRSKGGRPRRGAGAGEVGDFPR